MKKFVPTASIIGGVIILGGLIANQAILTNKVSNLEKYPVKVTETASPTSTPSATPVITYTLKKVSPTVIKAVK